MWLLTLAGLCMAAAAVQLQQDDEETRKRLAVLSRLVRDRSEERRLDACDELLEYGAAGRAILKKAMESRLKLRIKDFDKEVSSGAFKRARRWLAKDLTAARVQALEQIRNGSTYTKQSGQEEVDARVARVRALYARSAWAVVGRDDPENPDEAVLGLRAGVRVLAEVLVPLLLIAMGVAGLLCYPTAYVRGGSGA